MSAKQKAWPAPASAAAIAAASAVLSANAAPLDIANPQASPAPVHWTCTNADV